MNMYGYDSGRPDFDLPRNRDREALDSSAELSPQRIDSPNAASQPKDAYYSGSVEVSIPSHLGPLPPMLRENPMNVLYFHYFYNYTSRVLVTHECQSNPFRTILPQLAIQDENLLSLLLAYAACHRARLLCHAEPINRISTWVDRLFPRLRQALANGEAITDTLFGTCVMLASLTLSYPKAFAVPISWYDHLSVAQQMYKLRSQQHSQSPTNASRFFDRWFAYLDTFGSLSGNVYHGCYQDWSKQPFLTEDRMDTKCLVGYTNQSLVLLARVAELAKRCDYERKQSGQPSLLSITASQHLRVTLELAGLEVRHKRYVCVCESSSAPSTDVYRSINAALHHAALICLYRRIYLLPSNSQVVQTSVAAIMEALGPNEYFIYVDTPDVILPLYLAGCESLDQRQRSEVLQRLQYIGNAGMAQVARVCTLLWDCWDNGKDWVEMDHDIFLG